MLFLTTLDEAVIGETGKVFSTSPKLATGPDGKTYYVKGCNNPIAFLEVLGCSLGTIAGLKVPPATVARFGDGTYAAVEEASEPSRLIRTITPWLRKRDRIANYEDLYNVVAVDTWLANDDRNMGNVVGRSLGDGRIELFMIDFERSKALGLHPFTSIGEVVPKNLWPSEQLGQMLKSTRPPQCPQGVIDRIKSIPEERIQGLVLDIAKDVPSVTWQDSTVDVLFRRSRNIDTLVSTVWKTI